ncbi:MAG TPA: hypothetical protein VL295_10030, partial [Gemmatimonadales bacterium]|nr:hypothetical protein [Gemmatimonadales bacterium]
MMRRIRGAIGMGLTWALGWAISGFLLGALSNIFPGALWEVFFGIFDAPLLALAIPGFVGGILFSIVLGIAARKRRFEELSLPRFTLLGALGGLLLSFVPAALILTDPESAAGIWQVTAVLGVPFTLLSAVSATGSLLVARKGESPAVLSDGPAPRTLR